MDRSLLKHSLKARGEALALRAFPLESTFEQGMERFTLDGSTRRSRKAMAFAVGVFLAGYALTVWAFMGRNSLPAGLAGLALMGVAVVTALVSLKLYLAMLDVVEARIILGYEAGKLTQEREVIREAKEMGLDPKEAVRAFRESVARIEAEGNLDPKLRGPGPNF